MKKKINYIIIAILVILIIACGYLLVDKLIFSKSKTMKCEYENKLADSVFSVVVTAKIDSTGEILDMTTTSTNKYTDETTYKSVEESLTGMGYVANKKNLLYKKVEKAQEVKDEEGKILKQWYIYHKDSLEEQGYKCKVK